jgi:hypothetical protein
LLLATLLYGAIAYSVLAAAERAFDARMLRDRVELVASLERHGATREQAADVLAYEAAAAHHVLGLVHSTGSACIGMLMFLGVTLGALGLFRPERAA